MPVPCKVGLNHFENEYKMQNQKEKLFDAI